MSDLGTAKTMYLHVAGKKPRVVTLMHTLGKSESGQFYAHIGYAICNREFDNFNKKIGRKIAAGRLENMRTYLTVMYPVEATSWPKRMTFLLNMLATDTRVPRRLAAAVERYNSKE